MFFRLGRLVANRAAWCVALWTAAVVILAVTRPGDEALSRRKAQSFLPQDEPYNLSLEFERHAFPNAGSRTRTVLIFEADGKLSEAHDRYLADISNQIINKYADSNGWRVQSPFAQPYLRSRLMSEDGASAMIVVGYDVNYLTRTSLAHIDRLEKIVSESIPAGLSFEITGEGGLGRDVLAVAQKALHRTTGVTILALLVILALVYRAPLAALVPLISIGLSVVAAVMVLNQLNRFGWGIGTMEKILTIVLVFGSGTDFALFWLSSFRERSGATIGRNEAAAEATSRTGSAIVCSAATTVCGLLMLMMADLLPSRNAGRSLAIAMTVSVAAALTLAPSLAVLMRGALYWPRAGKAVDDTGRSGPWAFVAGLVTRRPLAMTVLTVVVFAWPALAGLGVHYTYDALGVVPADCGSAKGRRMAQRHFSNEQLFSWSCMLECEEIGADADQASDWSKLFADGVASIPGVTDVWSLPQPFGRGTEGRGASTSLARIGLNRVVRSQAAPFYHSPSEHALRFEIMPQAEPFSDEALRACQAVLEEMESQAATVFVRPFTVHATGLTPYMLNIKSVAQKDNTRVVVLVIAVVFAIVLLLVRHVRLAMVMMLATMGVYLVTLSVTEWFFVTYCGQVGIDWKVKLFAFVILVAVGQDYNIFLVTRLFAERRHHDAVTATRRAVSSTGSVISSCGAIMAATLGSLAASGLPFFQQLGFAFACGVLLDTFLVRPILVPAVYLLMQPAGAGQVHGSRMRL